jgi:hypothetical protein
MLTVRDLEPWGVRFARPDAAETLQVTSWLTGDREIKYSYDSPDDPDVDPLYLVFRVELERSAASAASAFRESVLAYRAGGAIKGARVREDPSLFAFGDATFAGFLEKQGRPLGNVVVVRTGTRVSSLLVGGIFFQSPDDLRELLEPRLRLIAAYREP